MDKTAARRLVRARLAAIPAGERAERSGRVVRALETLPPLRCEHAPGGADVAADGVVLAFMPMADEPDLRPLLTRLADARRLALPRIDWSEGRLTACLVDDLARDLVPVAGAKAPGGLMEPAGARPEAPLEQIVAILTPGVAFDRLGARLGRGKGHYDRLLARPERRGVAIGVAFSAQLLDIVPTTPDDCPVDLLVTDAGVIDCLAARSQRDGARPDRPTGPDRG